MQKKRRNIIEPIDLAYDDPEDLTPEERLDRIATILSSVVLRVIEEDKNIPTGTA